jgi:lipoprotein signal peptidase
MIKMSPRNIAIAAVASALGLCSTSGARAGSRPPAGNPLVVIKNALSFVYVENRNAAFGLATSCPTRSRCGCLSGSPRR